MNVRLRGATEADAGELAELELEAFPDPSWAAEDFLKYECTVAEVGAAIAGFLVSRETFVGTSDTPREREILNIAVGERFRRKGVGWQLLQHELKHGANVYLEVRESNIAAIQLYQKAGFIEAGRRREYYQNPLESAIVMRMKW